MTSRRSKVRAVGVVCVATAFVACDQASPSSRESLGQTRSAIFANGGFETGAAGQPPSSWTVHPYLDSQGVTVASPEARSDLNLQSGGTAATVILSTTAGPGTQPDANLGPGGTLRWPRYGNQCALVNQNGKDENVNSMTQTMTIGSGDVDPIDGRIHVRFVVAPVLENPGHPADEQPYYFVQLTNVTQGTTLFTDFNLSNQAGVPWQSVAANDTTYLYTDWVLNDISPGGSAIAAGDTVELEIIASGCSLGAHMGNLYVDGGNGANLPEVFVVASAPAQSSAASPLTYTLTYENGATTAASGASVTFNTPPNTTFASISAPGLTCTTPTAGMAGTVTCTIGSIAAGTGGSFQITVNVDAGTSGDVVEGNYTAQATGETPLLGPKVVTNIGCSADAQCSTGQWCDESEDSCIAKLVNGTNVPNDPGHMNPMLNGTCTTAAGMLTCASGVCDVHDNACGYADGDGPCTAGNATTVCRSGTCALGGNCGSGTPILCTTDASCPAGSWCTGLLTGCTTKLGNGVAIPNDSAHPGAALNGTCTADAAMAVCASGVCDTVTNACGYANGMGSSCTVATGPMLCESGVCSANGMCEPLGGCNVDADCHNGDWCDESINTCKAQLANGSMIPNDPPHTNPTLDGSCSPAAGALVCLSGVCDVTTKQCGYANGDGPCTGENGSVVCLSGLCDASGTCTPTVACTMDSQCVSGTWCDESAGFCKPTLSNGQAIPNDPPHMNPTVDGTCNAGAGMLVCTSAVCDTNDNECGYANGDGPCTAANGTTVCRSGDCSTDGTCIPMGTCNANGDCPSGMCVVTTHMCTPAPDAGVEDGGTDGGHDGGSELDGSTPHDSGTSDGAASGDSSPEGAGVYAEGGGCSSEIAGSARTPFSSSVLAGLGIAGIFVARRRRRVAA